MSATCIVLWIVIGLSLLILLFSRRRRKRQNPAQTACALLFVIGALYMLTGSAYVLSEKLGSLPDNHTVSEWDTDDAIDLALWPYRLVTGD